LDGKKPMRPKHFPRHQSTSEVSITVTLYPALTRGRGKQRKHFIIFQIDIALRFIRRGSVQMPAGRAWKYVRMAQVDSLEIEFVRVAWLEVVKHHVQVRGQQTVRLLKHQEGEMNGNSRAE
jgi:hypothetical protein